MVFQPAHFFVSKIKTQCRHVHKCIMQKCLFVYKARSIMADIMLHTENLVLRPMTESDVSDAYISWMNDEEITRFLESRFQKYTKDDLYDFIKKIQCDTTQYLFGIFLKDTLQHIGNIKLGPINLYHNHAEIGLLI